MSQVKCCLNIFCAYLLTFIDIFIYCYTGTEIPEHWYRMKSFDIAAEFGMDGKMDEWMDKWMGGWMDKWMDGWMDGWVLILSPVVNCHAHVLSPTHPSPSPTTFPLPRFLSLLQQRGVISGSHNNIVLCATDLYKRARYDLRVSCYIYKVCSSCVNHPIHSLIICPFINHLSIHQSFCPSIHLSIHSSIHMSI